VSTQKKKTKMEKTNYKIMERITLAWGKHKNGKNQLQKAGQTREKLEKQKQRCRCVRECRFGGSFFILLERKERVAVAVVGLEYLVYHSCSVALFVPSTLWTFGRRMNLSSILHPLPLESYSTVEVSPVSVGIHILFVTRVRIVSCSGGCECGIWISMVSEIVPNVFDDIIRVYT
jgi:hypothetical protein